MSILKLWESGSATGNPKYETILSEEAKEGIIIGRPSQKTEDGRVVRIPGCGYNTGILGVSRTHARIRWNVESGFTVEPWSAKVMLEALENVIQGPTPLENGSLIFFGPISVWTEILD